MAKLPYAEHTSILLDKLPYWFSMRKKSKDSHGADYLNIAGMNLDDALFTINYAYNQCYIDSIDLKQVDFCYKAIIAMPYSVYNIESVFANTSTLYEAKTLKEFFGIDLHNVRDKELYAFDNYYVDYDRNIIYVRQKFNADAYNDNGKLTVKFKDLDKSVDFDLVTHKVWNYLDEIGELVSCPRLPEEPNIEYKVRIQDVFKNKANSSRDGLINGIARELNIRRTILWKDTSQDIELDDAMIVLNSIKVNGSYYPQDHIFITAHGSVLLKPIEDLLFNSEVTYVYGLEMHQLWNKEDIKLQNELFTVEGRPKLKLEQYIATMNSESPIFWDHFHWNEHYWDQNREDVSGVGYIQHNYDGSIRGFKKFKKRQLK